METGDYQGSSYVQSYYKNKLEYIRLFGWPSVSMSSNQPKYQILFHKKSPPQDFIRGTLGPAT